MSDPFVLDSQTLSQIQEELSTGDADKYSKAYTIVTDAMIDPVTGFLGSGVDPAVYEWFYGAAKINR